MNHRPALAGLCGSRNGMNPNDVYGIYLKPRKFKPSETSFVSSSEPYPWEVRVVNMTVLAKEGHRNLSAHVDTYEFDYEQNAIEFINGWCTAMSIASITKQFFVLNHDDTVIDLLNNREWDSVTLGDIPDTK